MEIGVPTCTYFDSMHNIYMEKSGYGYFTYAVVLDQGVQCLDLDTLSTIPIVNFNLFPLGGEKVWNDSGIFSI